MKLDNKVYDILAKVQRWLPALAVLYLSLCKIWGLPYGQAVSDTILAVAAFLAATLEISTGIYHKDVSMNVVTEYLSDLFPSEDEPSEPDDSEPDGE